MVLNWIISGEISPLTEAINCGVSEWVTEIWCKVTKDELIKFLAEPESQNACSVKWNPQKIQFFLG